MSMPWCLRNFRGLVAIAALAGCDADVEVAEAEEEALAAVSAGVFVGAVEGSDTVIGAVVVGEKVRLYACAGPSQLESTRWFSGAVADDAFELVHGEWSITGAWVDGRLEGSLHSPEGDARAWSADPAAPGTLAGLYAAPTGNCTSGVVIRQDEPDGPIAAQGTWCDGLGHFAQIIILAPVAPSRRGIEVAVARGRSGQTGAEHTFYVAPASP